MPEFMSEQERYEHGCVPRDSWLGSVALDELQPQRAVSPSQEPRDGLFDAETVDSSNGLQKEPHAA